MKKIVLIFFAFMSVTIVSAQRADAYQSLSYNTSTTYSVGDIININNYLGVVFVVSPDGKHGRAVYIDGGPKGTWDYAVAWAQGCAPGWRLPNRDELQRLCKVLSIVNETIFFADGQKIEDTVYWTSEEYDESEAWLVSLEDGFTFYGYKSSLARICIVCAF